MLGTGCPDMFDVAIVLSGSVPGVSLARRQKVVVMVWVSFGSTFWCWVLGILKFLDSFALP